VVRKAGRRGLRRLCADARRSHSGCNPRGGFIDDLIFIPLAIALAVRFIPAPVLADCRLRSREIEARARGGFRAPHGSPSAARGSSP